MTYKNHLNNLKMHNINNKTIQSIIFPLLASFCIIFFLFSLYHRPIVGDDAWFAEQAYWFAKDGYVHTNLFEGFSLYNNHMLVYHKLHVWQGAAAYLLFGWNVYVFKAIPLPYVVLFLFMIFFFLKEIVPIESRGKIFSIFLFLFFINHLVFQQAFEYRPEIMMMCTGFLSYIFLHHAQKNNMRTYALLSGLMAGITALFHINGLIFILAGGLLLLINKEYKFIIWFGLGSVLGFLPYFYELTNIQNIKHYLYALQHSPAVSADDRSLLGWLKKLVFEYHRFTHHIYEFTYLLIFIITVSGNWKNISKNRHYKNLFKYTILLTILMAMLTTGSKTSYLLLSMPYVLLLVSAFFLQTLQIKKVTPFLIAVTLIYSVTNLDKDNGTRTYGVPYNPALYANILDKYNIKEGDQIFAPITFIFNEIGKVKIQCYNAYLLKYHNDPSQVTLKNIFEDIYRRKKSLAILNPSMLNDLKLTPQVGKIYHGYRYMGQEDNLSIFKRIEAINAS